MADFPHLKLPFRVDGGYEFHGGGRSEKGEQTLKNLRQRNQHGTWLMAEVDRLNDRWEKLKQRRIAAGMSLPNENDIPVFLKIDTGSFTNLDSLANWGIEVISEEEDGYIIGASTDNLQLFKKNIQEFLDKKGTYKDTASKIWEFSSGAGWRQNLLKGELGQVWGTLRDDDFYTIEISVSCYSPNTKQFPQRKAFDSEEKYNRKVEEYRAHERSLALKRDEKQRARESEIEAYVTLYNGEILEIWDNAVDAVFFKLSIPGGAIRDLVFTYQYLFEIKIEPRFLVPIQGVGDAEDIDLETSPPPEGAIKICVIDSGIQENHRLLAKAIDAGKSRSYVNHDPSVADFVRHSGHGTKVAGAILYPYQIPKAGKYQLETIVQNARILDRDNRICQREFSPKLMEKIVGHFPETRIFNLSVCDDDAYDGTHMPALAASIDKLMHEKDVIFVIAAGNVHQDSAIPDRFGIKQYLNAGIDYPDFLNFEASKIANPGVSHFAITVGSISAHQFDNQDYASMAGINRVSPFSRTGLGLWGCIKPDVVEFGGDLVKNKLSAHCRHEESVSPELVHSTLHGSGFTGRDGYGTSFSTPKVSYVLGRLQAEHPNETAQMYRALLIQSARLPEHCFDNPKLNDFRYYGYGIPSLDRALNNSSRRITFIQNGKLGPRKADIYHLKVPPELRGEGKEFKILVEVTLAFTAKTRVTRRGAHSYLANWLEWKSSKYNESFNSFRARTLTYLEFDDEELESADYDEGNGAIKWCLRENPKWSNNEISRNKSTVQKSWAMISPHQLNSEFSIAVIGLAR